jgi:hypothetical protein
MKRVGANTYLCLGNKCRGPNRHPVPGGGKILGYPLSGGVEVWRVHGSCNEGEDFSGRKWAGGAATQAGLLCMMAG